MSSPSDPNTGLPQDTAGQAPVVDGAVAEGATVTQGADGAVEYDQTQAGAFEVTDPTTGQTAQIYGSQTNFVAGDNAGDAITGQDTQGVVQMPDGSALYAEEITASGTVVDPTTGEQDQFVYQQDTLTADDGSAVTYTQAAVAHEDGSVDCMQSVSGSASSLYDDPFSTMLNDDGTTAGDQNVSDLSGGFNQMGFGDGNSQDASGDDSSYASTAADGTGGNGGYDNSGYDNTGSYDNNGYDNSGSYDNNGSYDNSAYDNSGSYDNNGSYDNSGYDASGYDAITGATDATACDGTIGFDPTQAGVDTSAVGADMGLAASG